MNRRDRDELDAHIEGRYEEVTCAHDYISWHGERGECQDCGEIVSAPNPDTEAILTKLFDQWRDDILRRNQ